MNSLATFAAGCFWGVEANFATLSGVLETKAGYMGGTVREPSYQEVCSGSTGHAEAVQIKYDPDTITYEQLLAEFWEMHDPTTLNRQGTDAGSQYRSAIFYHNETQKTEAEQSKAMMNNSGVYSRSIVTAIVPANTFWNAEEEHQQYLAKRDMGCDHI
jgi:methionine-S-sulfoxide reductase